jgi:hypothetical protein
MTRKNHFLQFFCIFVLLISSFACDSNSSSAHETYFYGEVVDSNGNKLNNQTVVLFVDGLEEKRVVTKNNLGFILELDDPLGVYDKYQTEYSSKSENERALDIGNMQVDDNRYFFVPNKSDPKQIHEYIVLALGDASRVSPTRLKLGIGEYQARQVLYDQVRRWTQVVSITLDNSKINFYLTYCSPQLLEAAIEYQSIQKNLSADEIKALESDVKTRLREQDTIAFLLRMVSSSSDLTIKFGDKFSSTTWLENIHGDKLPPSEYDPYLDYQIPTSGIAQGYIYFPKSNGGKMLVDVDQEPSIFVGSSGINISNGPQTSTYNDVTWHFDLVPIDFPLADLENRPPAAISSGAPTGSTPSNNLSISDILGIINFIFDFIAVLLPK